MGRTFDYFADPGHGWVRVPRTVIHELGIQDDISICSMERGDYVFLECDADALLFVTAWEAKHGSPPKLEEHHSNRQSRIRNYNAYRSAGPQGSA